MAATDHLSNPLSPDSRHSVVQVLNAFSQFLNYQKSFGNQSVNISSQGLQTLEKWGTPSRRPPKFSGQGPLDAKIVLVDSEGGFFDGASGQLLVKILSAMQLTPSSVFICNAENFEQLAFHVRKNHPKALIALGEKAGQGLKNSKAPLETFRGSFFNFCGVQVMATHHPSDLLKNPALKRAAWDDMKQVMACAGLGRHDS